MSEKPKTRLFFLKSQPHDLKTIETYLSKRDYEVMSASDLREGILKLIPFEPTFVFIAWDHPNDKISSVPKVINQSSAAIVVPYSLSSAKEHTRKLDASGYAHKLYPPVSGPSIMRLISKIEKELLEEAKDPTKKRASLAGSPISTNVTINSNSNLPEDLDQFLRDIESSDKQREEAKKAYQAELLKRNQAKLKSFQLQNLDEKLKKLLQDKFQNDVRAQMQEMTQSSNEGESGAIATAEPGSFRKLLCVIVQSATWCGYLLVASQIEINNDDYKTLIQAWLQDQLVDLNEISAHDYFEVKLDVGNYSDLKNWVQEKSDYLEFIEIDKNEIFVSFFTLDPKYLILELNDNHEMVEVPIEIIDVDRAIPFSLFIHLPENKKYLLYTLPHQSLMMNQKQRLIDKAVVNLFTPIEFEAELKKLKAEKFLNSSYQKMKKDITT